MKKIFTLFFLSSIAFTTIQAQLNQEIETSFQGLLFQWKAWSQATGLSVSVYTNDGSSWSSAIGISAEDVPLSTSETFGIGSVTKTIVSATMLQLQEDGLLDLDDPISLYLDDYENVDPEITLRQLLNHTSGIFNYTDHPEFFADAIADPEHIYTPVEVLEWYVDSPNFAAGTEWAYSNTNYLLLGMVIESVSGQAWYEEVRERFALDTEYPSFSVPPFESSTADLAHLWMDTTLTWQPLVDIQAAGWSLDAIFSGASAAGAYVSTPHDLAKWAQTLYSGGHLSTASMDELFEVIPPSEEYGLGVGVGELPCGIDIVGHTGGIFYTTATFFDPETQMAVSVHCNDASTSPVAELAFDILCEYSTWILNTSVDDQVRNQSFKVYPNPAGAFVQVELEAPVSGTAELILYNSLGQIVLTRAVDQTGLEKLQTTLDLQQAAISSGLYHLQVRGEGYSFQQKLIVE
jgi:D-alanyl-D-alanine carboxypeptidase